MHAVSILPKCLHKSLDRMDKRQVRTLLGAVSALLLGRRLVLMELARHWPGALRVRAPLKRLDRLLGNPGLQGKRDGLYGEMAGWLVRNERPVILVDWSPLKANGQWHLLRAAVAVGGRSMTLYEAVYPQKVMGTPKTEQAFIRRLAQLLPSECKPIVVTDAGYRAPWFRAVTELGWDYVGRLRSGCHMQPAPTEAWIPVRSLFAKASTRWKRFANVRIVKARPWVCDLVLYKQPRRGRVNRGIHGQRRRNSDSREHAKRGREPWLLVTSLNARQLSAKKIGELYSRRMQIEEGFRDLKSARYGVAFRYSLTRSAKRIEILLLIHALATFVAWLVGISLGQQTRNGYAGMNTLRTRRHYSSLRLGFEALKRGHVSSLRLLWRTLVDPPQQVLNQMACIP